MIYIYYIKYGFSFDACRMYIGLIQVNSKLATKTRHLVLSLTLGPVPLTTEGPDVQGQVISVGGRKDCKWTKLPIGNSTMGNRFAD